MAKLKNMIGPGTSIPIRSGFPAQVFILNPRASSSTGSMSQLYYVPPVGEMVLTRSYPSIKTRAARVPILSGQPERKQQWNAYISGREEAERTTLHSAALM